MRDNFDIVQSLIYKINEWMNSENPDEIEWGQPDIDAAQKALDEMDQDIWHYEYGDDL